jgi:hypothetical protein
MLDRHSRAFCAALLLLLWWLPGICFADADDGTDPSVLIERLHLQYVVEQDGTYLLTVEDVRTVVRAPALPHDLDGAVRYDHAVESVVAVEAFTQKTDGRRIPAQVTERDDGPASDLFPSGDPRHREVAFADAVAGNRLVARYAIRCTRSRFAGHFAQLVTVPFYRARDVQVVFDLPAGMPLHADAAGFVPVQTDAPPGRRRYAWRYVDGSNQRREAGAVSLLDDGRHLAVSTFAGYSAFAAAVRRAVTDNQSATAGTSTAAQARQLTAGLPDAHAKALALAAWAGRYAPAERVRLLGTMLQAAGIASTPALVNKGNAYNLPDTPAPALFNHMLLYAPALDLYLEPGADALPADVLGKPALLLDTGTFGMTPLLQPHRVVSSTRVDFGQEAPSAVRDAVSAMTRERTRRQTWVCPAIDAADETIVRLPRGMRIVALPPPLQLMNGGIAYSASHTRQDGADGAAILVRRRLTFRHGTPTCSPADHDAMQPVLARIVSDLGAKVVTADGPQPAGGALVSALRQPRARNAATAPSVSSKRKSTRSRPER